MIDEAVVRADDLYYRIDMESGDLVRERIHWHEDLPEHLPALAVSQREAEAMVEGEVTGSRLQIGVSDLAGYGITEPDIREPCWFVWNKRRGEPVAQTTVIGAISGRIYGSYCPC